MYHTSLTPVFLLVGKILGMCQVVLSSCIPIQVWDIGHVSYCIYHRIPHHGLDIGQVSLCIFPAFLFIIEILDMYHTRTYLCMPKIPQQCTKCPHLPILSMDVDYIVFSTKSNIMKVNKITVLVIFFPNAEKYCCNTLSLFRSPQYRCYHWQGLSAEESQKLTGVEISSVGSKGTKLIQIHFKTYEFRRLLWRRRLTGIGIPVIKIRQSHGRLIFTKEIHIPGKIIFIL